jgi:hypothetical protein
MYIDIEPNDNLDEACMATFAEQGQGLPIERIHLWRTDRWCWCAICGWSAAGPVAARILPIEDSGDGPALLVVGGEHGLRLTELTDESAPQPAWQLDSPAQWAEGFLICRPDARYR